MDFKAITREDLLKKKNFEEILEKITNLRRSSNIKESNKLITKIRPLFRNIDFESIDIWPPSECFQIGGQCIDLFRRQVSKRRHFVKGLLQDIFETFFRYRLAADRKFVQLEYPL